MRKPDAFKKLVLFEDVLRVGNFEDHMGDSWCNSDPLDEAGLTDEEVAYERPCFVCTGTVRWTKERLWWCCAAPDVSPVLAHEQCVEVKV